MLVETNYIFLQLITKHADYSVDCCDAGSSQAVRGLKEQAGTLGAMMQSAGMTKCHLPHCNTMLDFDFIRKPTVCQSWNDGKSSLLKILVKYVAEPAKVHFLLSAQCISSIGQIIKSLCVSVSE